MQPGGQPVRVGDFVASILPIFCRFRSLKEPGPTVPVIAPSPSASSCIKIINTFTRALLILIPAILIKIRKNRSHESGLRSSSWNRPCLTIPDTIPRFHRNVEESGFKFSSIDSTSFNGLPHSRCRDPQRAVQRYSSVRDFKSLNFCQHLTCAHFNTFASQDFEKISNFELLLWWAVGPDQSGLSSH